jgi:chemosensory pili system protein ChpC
MSISSHESTAAQDIRGVLIQIDGARLLLPNATIAEVLSYADPEPVENAPAWLLGRIRWRGWQLPLVSFARIAGLAEERGGLGSKVVVLKALGGDPKLPHFALLTQGFPRLVTVSRDALVLDTGNSEALPNGVQARVLLKDDAALIPDIGNVEASLREALAA